MEKYSLRLYITGRTARSDTAIGNVRRLCEQDLAAEYELDVIDILEHPQQAEEEKILTTPTLVRMLPPPARRVVGDLSDRERVLYELDIRPPGPRQP